MPEPAVLAQEIADDLEAPLEHYRAIANDLLDRLKRAGCGVGHAAFGSTWRVDGTNRENVLLAHGTTLAEA